MAAGYSWVGREVPPNNPYPARAVPSKTVPAGVLSIEPGVAPQTRLCRHMGAPVSQPRVSALSGDGQSCLLDHQISPAGHCTNRENERRSLVLGVPHLAWEQRSQTVALGIASRFKHPNLHLGRYLNF